MRNGEFLHQTDNQSNDDYIVSGLLPRGQVVVIGGLPGEGKSFFLAGCDYSVAYGAPFLERPTLKGPILIIDSETPKKVLVNRIIKIKKGLEDDGYSNHDEVDIQHYSGFRLDDRSTWVEVERVIKDIKPVLISLDHLRALHSQNENDSQAMERVAQAISDLAGISNSTVIVCHHLGKKESGSFYQRLRGSSVIHAKSEVAFEIRALTRRDGRLESIGVIPQARKGITPIPFRVLLEETDESIRFRYDGAYNPVENRIMDRLCHMVVHIFIDDSQELTVNQVKSQLAGEASDERIRESLHILTDRELIRVRRDGKSHRFLYGPRPNVSCGWCKPSSS